MQKCKLLFLALLTIASGGCQLISIVASPNGVHKVEPAKVDMSAFKKSKYAVVVEYPGRGSATANLYYKITKAVSSQLKDHLKVKDIVKYKDVAKLRNSVPNYGLLSAYQIGKLLKADIVIVVTIADYSLYELPTAGYYSGSLVVSWAVFDVKDQVKLWPAEGKGKDIELNVEAAKGEDKISDRLSAAAGHCVVRDLYDCQSIHYKVLEEKVDHSIGQW